MDRTQQFLRELVESDGCPGYESDVYRVMSRYLKGVGKVSSDRLGSFICEKKGTSAGPRVMLAGHLDEVGRELGRARIRAARRHVDEIAADCLRAEDLLVAQAVEEDRLRLAGAVVVVELDRRRDGHDRLGRGLGQRGRRQSRGPEQSRYGLPPLRAPRRSAVELPPGARAQPGPRLRQSQHGAGPRCVRPARSRSRSRARRGRAGSRPPSCRCRTR